MRYLMRSSSMRELMSGFAPGIARLAAARFKAVSREGAAGRAAGQDRGMCEVHLCPCRDGLLRRAAEAPAFPWPGTRGRMHPRRSGSGIAMRRRKSSGSLHAAGLATCRASAIRLQFPLCPGAERSCRPCGRASGCSPFPWHRA